MHWIIGGVSSFCEVMAAPRLQSVESTHALQSRCIFSISNAGGGWKPLYPSYLIAAPHYSGHGKLPSIDVGSTFGDCSVKHLRPSDNESSPGPGRCWIRYMDGGVKSGDHSFSNYLQIFALRANNQSFLDTGRSPTTTMILSKQSRICAS